MTLARPLFNRVIVRRHESNTQQGGLHLPENALEEEPTGTVLAVGIGLVNSRGRLVPLTVKVNDIVSFNHRAGTKIITGKTSQIILKETDIYGVIE